MLYYIQSFSPAPAPRKSQQHQLREVKELELAWAAEPAAEAQWDWGTRCLLHPLARGGLPGLVGAPGHHPFPREAELALCEGLTVAATLPSQWGLEVLRGTCFLASSVKPYKRDTSISSPTPTHNTLTPEVWGFFPHGNQISNTSWLSYQSTPFCTNDLELASDPTRLPMPLRHQWQAVVPRVPTLLSALVTNWGFPDSLLRFGDSLSWLTELRGTRLPVYSRQQRG